MPGTLLPLNRRTLVALLGAVLLAAAGIGWAVSNVAAQATEDTVLIHTDAATHAFKVEVVDTDATRARGLMFRQELAPNAGMLFDFIEERPASFWMENTFIPLDMIFARADGEIVRVHANAIPHDRTPIPSGEPVRFVLEIPGGRAAELGITAGDVLEHPRVTAEKSAP
ncbi:DUF192 domain-containing protein [Pelagibacterium xiamenense]|uniref:DUF192 domain-containing protein n=1 Tax=Pelagibacterium xiamenense TaxID=2901140 RepID=UPI001E3B2BA7|nr:DUF192 domain-containing protein [Pelagibacterium xiamenense]MCD7060861.1 DUF192 domain-containing protein [Pelagibacterium xiamenense]